MSDSAETPALTVLEQRTVLFYDDELVAVRAADGHIYVAVRQMCDALGLDRASQVRRIKNQNVLADGYKGDVKLTSPGGPQTAGVLRVDLVPLWLTGIRTSMVRPDLQARLERYQREAAKVLYEAFLSGRLSLPTDWEEGISADSPTAQAYRIALAVAQLARAQLVLEARLNAHDQQLAGQANELQTHAGRLDQLEAAFKSPARQISDQQASQLSQAVRAVGLELSRRSGRNEYGGVYGELYRRFGITSYKLLPAAHFNEAIGFLTQWYQALTGASDVPF